MKIIEIHTYRDGGTVCIETDQGHYWMASKLEKDKEGMVFKGKNYFQGEAVQVTDIIELGMLIKEMKWPTESYLNMKRQYFRN